MIRPNHCHLRVTIHRRFFYENIMLRKMECICPITRHTVAKLLHLILEHVALDDIIAFLAVFVFRFISFDSSLFQDEYLEYGGL